MDFVMKIFKCTLPWSHDWTKWETINEGNILRIDEESKTGIFTEQRRTCQICGKVKLRIERAK